MPLSSSTSSFSSSGHPRCGLFSSASDGSDDLLLCGEDAGSFSDDDGQMTDRALLLPSGLKCPAGLAGDGEAGEDDEEEVVAMWAAAEGEYSPEMEYRSGFSGRPGFLDPAARRLSVAWVLKVREFYQFRPLTAYLAVNYMDRFLARHSLPQQHGAWPVQLLAVACLSLAAKMEETLVPSLLDLQVEDTRFVFEPQTVLRMELLVLDSLDWRLRAITPFTFVDFFASKADPSRSYVRYLVSRAKQIVLATIEEVEFLDQCPSAIAAAAVTCAASEAPALSSINPELAASWCDGLSRDGILNCYQLMQELFVGGGRNNREILSQLRTRTSFSMGSDVLSASPSSSSSSSPNKRRKLDSSPLVVEGKGEREINRGDQTN
uniref:Cyclin-D1-1 n=1 Tax=Anthurium amnicola TaxID=1678845 RepID=A0A1D1YJ41_9ARAE